MSNFSLFRLASAVFLSLSFSSLICAQIYTPPPAAVTTTAAQPASTTNTAPTTAVTRPVAVAPTRAPLPRTSATVTATSVTSPSPGYRAQGNYRPGRTVADVIARD